MIVDIYCENPSPKDLELVEKIMAAGKITSFQIKPFKITQLLRLQAPINIICSDGHPNIDGDELVYLWPSPSTISGDSDKKKEVWSEIKNSIIPMIDVLEKKPDPSIKATELFGDTISWERFQQVKDQWLKDGKHLIVSLDGNRELHVFPKENLGEYDLEMTLDELFILATALVSFGGGAARVQGKDAGSSI